jgi:two-component system NtrC family sensor kinase
MANSATPYTPKVLAVDDVQANLATIEALLDDMDCEVVRASNGNEALRQLLRHDFAVMLLDVQMPEMDGYETAHHARHNPATSEVPIVFLTAADRTEQSILRGYGSGAIDFLFKPIESEVLRGKVRIFLELHRSRRQIADARDALARSNAELQAAYAELRETQAQVIQSAKMASLGGLVAGVAHEINNPLSFTISHLTTIKRCLVRTAQDLGESLSGNEHWARAQERLSEMDTGLTRIRSLILKLRTFSRLDEGELKQVDVKDSLDSVLTILSHRMRDRIEVVTHFGEPQTIDCYPSLLNQAVLNLIVNAIEAIEGPGKIWIETGLRGSDYTIEVTDTGPGIPAQIRERVFEPFFTTKPIGEGTGLGLSITYSIVKKHGGKLELLDAPGGGTRAVLRIPARQPAPASST